MGNSAASTTVIPPRQHHIPEYGARATGWWMFAVLRAARKVNEKDGTVGKPFPTNLCARRWTVERAQEFGVAIAANTTARDLLFTGGEFEPGALGPILEGIRANRSLESLSLSRIRLDDAMIDDVARCVDQHPTLQSIALCSNLLTDAAAPALASMLQSSTTLKSLDITDNPLTEEGHRLLVEAVRDNDKLPLVHLGGVPLHKCIDALGPGIPSSLCHADNYTILALLRRLRGLAGSDEGDELLDVDADEPQPKTRVKGKAKGQAQPKAKVKSNQVQPYESSVQPSMDPSVDPSVAPSAPPAAEPGTPPAAEPSAPSEAEQGVPLAPESGPTPDSSLPAMPHTPTTPQLTN